MTVKITLACTECKQRNYNKEKNKKNNPDRLEMKKYCRFCKKVPFTAKVKNFFGRITKYFRDTKSELKKVVWPSKEDTRNNTITVIVVVVIAAVVLVLLDMAFGGIIHLLIGA